MRVKCRSETECAVSRLHWYEGDLNRGFVRVPVRHHHRQCECEMPIVQLEGIDRDVWGEHPHSALSGRSLRCGSILISDRRKHHKLIVWPFRWTEGVLAEPEKTRFRMIEYSQAAGPMLNILVIPCLREQRTVFPQHIDQSFDPSVPECVAVVFPEFS
jgi:hypothetical protein